MSMKVLTYVEEPAVDRLEGLLIRRLGNRIRDLHLEVSADGGLIICGRADSYHLKQLAQHAVMEFSETRDFANEIIVE